MVLRLTIGRNDVCLLTVLTRSLFSVELAFAIHCSVCYFYSRIEFVSRVFNLGLMLMTNNIYGVFFFTPLSRLHSFGWGFQLNFQLSFLTSKTTSTDFYATSKIRLGLGLPTITLRVKCWNRRRGVSQASKPH
jgi:hypothetical protein